MTPVSRQASMVVGRSQAGKPWYDIGGAVGRLKRCSSCEILQDLAESCHRQTTMSNGTASYASSVIVTDDEYARDTYDHIENDLDALKAEIARLKAEVAEKRPQENLIHRVTDLNPWQFAAETEQESPASRLRREHERLEVRRRELADQPKIQEQTLPPNVEDFPALGGKPTQTNLATATTRSASYASAALSSMKVNNIKTTSAGSKSRLLVEIKPVTAAHDSALTSPQTVKVEGSASPTSPRRGVPHFAQPTKSTARRVDETLQKRKSLPTTWTGTPLDSGSRGQKLPSMPHCHEGSWEMVDVPSAEPISPKSASKSPSASQSPQLKKKVTSYMAPTAATTQRTVATLGDENLKRPAIRTKVMGLKVDTARTGSSHGESHGDPSWTVSPTESMAQERAAMDVKLNSPKRSQYRSRSVFGGIANTSIKRRNSHEDVFQPIFNKLNKHGLLKSPCDEPFNENPFESRNRDIIREHQLPGGQYEAPSSPANQAALDDIVLKARAGVANRTVVLPPHLRARQARQCSAVSAVSTVSNISHVTQTTVRIAQQRPEALPALATMIAKTNPSSTLRGDATEFTPMWKPETIAQQFGLLSWQGTLDYKPQEVWDSMSPDVQACVLKLREFKKAGTQSAATTAQGRPQSPSKRQEMRFWGKLLASSPSLKASDKQSPTEPPPENLVEATSPNETQPDQSPKTVMSPEQSPIQWAYQIANNQQQAPTFGRAVAPSMSTPTESAMPLDLSIPSMAMPQLAGSEVTLGHTAQVSPTSKENDANLARENAYIWRIGPNSVSHGPGFGWRGGDGKEICFSGHGPQAEYNPNAPVNIQFFPAPIYNNTGISNGPGALNVPRRGGRSVVVDDASPTPKVWPRSMKQWAELVSSQKMPCGNMEITNAGESIPLMQPLAGVCNSCTSGSY